jgi:hypothetical protein
VRHSSQLRQHLPLSWLTVCASFKISLSPKWDKKEYVRFVLFGYKLL